MKYIFTILLLLGTVAEGESLATSKATTSLPDAPGQASVTARAFSQQPFWTPQTRFGAAIFASLITADAITTQRGLNQGFREANPLARPFVTRGVAGSAAGSALGFGVGLGTVYLLHRTHHFKAERFAMGLIVGGESVVVASNIAAIHK